MCEFVFWVACRLLPSSASSSRSVSLLSVVGIYGAGLHGPAGPGPPLGPGHHLRGQHRRAEPSWWWTTGPSGGLPCLCCYAAEDDGGVIDTQSTSKQAFPLSVAVSFIYLPLSSDTAYSPPPPPVLFKVPYDVSTPLLSTKPAVKGELVWAFLSFRLHYYW